MNTSDFADLKARIEAAKKCDEWGKHGLRFTFTPEKPGQEARLWYGDGDLCAVVHGNMGLGIDGDAIGLFFATALADMDALLGMIRDECCLDPACHFCKTFAEAVEFLVNDKVEREREQCCRDLCEVCDRRYETHYHKPTEVNGGWFHDPIPNKGVTSFVCGAARILKRAKRDAEKPS